MPLNSLSGVKTAKSSPTRGNGGTRGLDPGPPPWARGSIYKKKVVEDPGPNPHTSVAIHKEVLIPPHPKKWDTQVRGMGGGRGFKIEKIIGGSFSVQIRKTESDGSLAPPPPRGLLFKGGYYPGGGGGNPLNAPLFGGGGAGNELPVAHCTLRLPVVALRSSKRFRFDEGVYCTKRRRHEDGNCGRAMAV